MDADPRTSPRLELPIVDLGRMGYERALGEQRRHHAEVLRARARGAPEPGRILLVEHDPVITVSNRDGARAHLLASPEALDRAGVEVRETDRGGDITYHGPGQLVVYPILDLNALGIRLHPYLRTLEQAVIDACARFGLPTGRDPEATGVWTIGADGAPRAKVCAIGIRVRRWITLHGLAVNVAPNLDHFGLIVPCGLAGRLVTSLERELDDRAPSMEAFAPVLTAALLERLGEGGVVPA